MPETWVGFLGLENPRPWGGNGNSLQYSCLENPLDSRAWQALVHGVAKSWTRLSNWAHTHSPCSRHDAFGLKSKIASAIMAWKHKVLFGTFYNQGRRVCFSESFLPHSLQDLTSSGISFHVSLLLSNPHLTEHLVLKHCFYSKDWKFLNLEWYSLFNPSGSLNDPSSKQLL